MKRYIGLLVLMGASVPLAHEIHGRSYISNRLSGGRLGDNLLSYAHTRWVCYAYDMPFKYRPFKYSDDFKFSRVYPQNTLTDNECQTLAKLETHKGEPMFKRDGNVVYLLPYFPEYSYTLRKYWQRRGRMNFQIDWNDPVFKKILQDELAPIEKLDLPPVEIAGYHVVTVHIRTGGGFDKVRGSGDATETHLFEDAPTNQNGYMDETYPLKLPALSYYADAVKLFADILSDKPLHVRILTDAAEPDKLIEKFKRLVGLPDVVYNYRTAGNRHTANVLTDFFTLVQSKYLIRSESNFSLMAEKLGNMEIVMYPTYGVFDNGEFVITETETKFTSGDQVHTVAHVAARTLKR